MASNTEMIDQLVSPQALKDFDLLDKKLISSYEEMERTLAVVQKLNVEFNTLGKNFREASKHAEATEKSWNAATQAMNNYNKASEDMHKHADETVRGEKEKAKATNESAKAAQKAATAEEKRAKYLESVIHLEGDHTKELETQEKATKKLEMTTKQLLSVAKETAKGIDISDYIKKNEDGMKSYSDAINAANQQLGRIQGLQELLKEEFNQGKISEAEYSSVVAELTQTQTEYGATLESLQKKYEDAKEAQRQVFNPDSSSFNKLSSDVQEQTLLLVGMNTELNETRNAQKELEKSYKDGGISLGEYIEKKAQLNAQEAELSNGVKDLSKELQLNNQIANTAAGSYDNLTARYSLMKIQINAMGEATIATTKAEKENIEQKRALEKEAEALYKRMNELQKATGKAQLQVGDYTIVNRELEGALSTLSPALGGTVSGIKAVTKAGLAFIATPIGVFLALIVAGLAALTSWFTRTEEGQNALAVGTAAFEKVLNSILNVVDKVGEWLFKAFSSPKEAIQELGDMIVNNLMKRLEGIAKIGAAVAKIFSEDWKQGFKDLGDAAIQTLSGIEDGINKISNGWDDMVAGMERAAEIQSKLNNLATKKRELSVEESKNQAEMNRLRNIANDQEKSASERLAANNKYMEIANGLGEKNVAIAKESYELRKSQIEENKRGSTLSIEEKDELAKLEADMYKAEADHQQKLFTATRTNNRLRKEGINAAKEAMRERNKELKAIGELESFNYRKSADLQQQIFKDATLGYDERKDALKAYIADEISIIKTKEKEEVLQEGLTETQKKLIKEKALYEIFKLEQKYAVESNNLKIKQAEDEVKLVQDAISERSEVMNQQMQDDLVAEAKSYEQRIALNVNSEQERTKITEDYQKRRMEILRKYNQDAFEYEVAQLEKAVNKTELSEEKKLAIYKKIDELKKKNAKDMAEFEIQQTEDKADKMLTAEDKFNKIMGDARVKSLQAMWSMAMDMATMYYDEQLKAIDALEKREQKYWDDKIALIDENVEAGLMSEEEADARKRIIEETQVEREKQYDQERKEIQRKQAIWNKANTMVQTAIAGANAVVVAMGAPFPLNLVLPAVIGGMVAAQLAMIAAQSIPAYAKGTDYHKGGLALVGDGGRSEMVILPSGEIWKTPDTDTFVNLPRGTEVLPDYKEAMMNIGTHPNMSYYDDDSGKMILMNDEVLRNNTKEANNQLSSINRGINAIRYNNMYSGKRNGSGYRFTNNIFI